VDTLSLDSLSSLYENDGLVVGGSEVTDTLFLRPVSIFPIDKQDWNNEIVDQFQLVEWVEIHLPCTVCCGIMFSYPSRNSEILEFIMEVDVFKVAHEQVSIKEMETPNLVLRDSKKPVFIKEGHWDLFWFGFKEGYAAFYLRKPQL